MEALRTARPPLAAAFNDATRATTRKAVLLVTDGQPTFLLRSSDIDCKREPDDNIAFSANGKTDAVNGPFTNGCKQGVPSYDDKAQTRRFLYREVLTRSDCLVAIDGTHNDCSLNLTSEYPPDNSYNQGLYKNTLKCARSMKDCATNGAMYEADLIRKCGYNNSTCTAGGAHDVLVFAILIGIPTPNAPQGSADRNAKCLLSRIANATEVLNTGTNTIETLATVCRNPADTTVDGDTHADLQQGWPCGAGPCIDTTQEKGKVYIVDQNGNIQAQLQQVFNEIAAILKLRLTL
jgi:hypothetical protein